MKILIGSAWPFANGSLHIGHIASLLPGDILARYHRAKGDDVYYVSGSDCHGTPLAIKARQENKSPREISDSYHDEFCMCFSKLGFSYDVYGKTSSEEHKQFVVEFHKKLYDSGYVYEKETPQTYCDACGAFLADRFVEGKCPACGEKARGDQCDACGKVLEPEQLINPVCGVCGAPTVFKPSKHLYIAISRLERELTDYIASHSGKDGNSGTLDKGTRSWRKNAVAFSKRYIDEGLRDRALTRDLTWGVEVPKDGYENKRIYVWAENVLGYLSMSKLAAQARQTGFEELWKAEARHYYVHGKDNIPFHTIILPALLLANGDGWRLPDEIVSSEHLTLEGRRISTSQNWAIWITDIIDKLDPDSLRYFFIANGPERRDTDFSRREYINSHNGELLGAYGNLINRTLAFVYKYMDAAVPACCLDAAVPIGAASPEDIMSRIASLYSSSGELIENGCFKEALDSIFEFVRFGNKYFDTGRPWETRNTDPDSCNTVIYNCVQIIANLSVLLAPFLPFSSEKVMNWFGTGSAWQPKKIPAGYVIPKPEVLFTRIDKSDAENLFSF